jgi:hypothetical protein
MLNDQGRYIATLVSEHGQYLNETGAYVLNKLTPGIISMPTIQHLRGSVNNLPAEGLKGQLFITEDTAELYGGQGAAKPLTRFSAKRYLVGLQSFVLASGYGITLEKIGNTCNFVVPKGVELFSTSIHFTALDIGSNTNCYVGLGINAGCGQNEDYTSLYTPQFQVWADVNNSRAFKTGILGNFNLNANTLELLNLNADQAIWINLSF